MNPRRIALLISSLVLAALATPATATAAGAPTLDELRAQLRETRQRLTHARGTLASARSRLVSVQAILAIAGDPPVAVAEPTAASLPTDPATADPTSGAAEATATPAFGDPELAAAIAAVEPALAARILADGVIDEDEVRALRQRLVKWRGVARRFRRAETTLEARIALRLRIADWNRRGAWRPLIEIAARRYDVDADGLYRLMMHESRGRQDAGTTFKGLFQYHPGTWVAMWNPWRSESIYDGWAQIRATAYAIRRGMGPSSWPSTYHLAF